MSPETTFGVEPARKADLPAILALVSSCADAPQWSETVWQEFATASADGGTGRLLLVTRGSHGAVLGLLAATLLAEETELESLLVAPAARRRGLGQGLILEWLVWAKAKGAKEALLEVRASNHGALVLYDSLEFVREGRRRAYYRAPVEDAVLMRRQVELQGDQARDVDVPGKV